MIEATVKRDKKFLAPPSKAVTAKANAKDAMAKLGALVRQLNTLGVYEKCRSQLSWVEGMIRKELDNE